MAKRNCKKCSTLVAIILALSMTSVSHRFGATTCADKEGLMVCYFNGLSKMRVVTCKQHMKRHWKWDFQGNSWLLNCLGYLVCMLWRMNAEAHLCGPFRRKNTNLFNMCFRYHQKLRALSQNRMHMYYCWKSSGNPKCPVDLLMGIIDRKIYGGMKHILRCIAES